MPITQKILYILEYTALRTGAALLGILPEALVLALARLAGLFVYHVLKIRHRVCLANLKLALGDSHDRTGLERICRASYANIGMTFFEILILPKLVRKTAGMAGMTDFSLISNNLRKGRGVVLVTCHLGNWELAGTALAATGIPVTGVGARQSNPYVDAYIYRTRTALGLQVVQPDASIKHLVKALKNHEVIGLVSDQNAGEYGVFVNFFGQAASTPRGAAQLVLKYKTPLLVLVTVRTAPGCYKNIIQEVAIGTHDTVESITQRFTTIMEGIIRQYPEQYLWMHRRWKTRPPGEG